MIDITAAREAYNMPKVSNAGLVPGELNPADKLAKHETCKALNNFMQTEIESATLSQ